MSGVLTRALGRFVADARWVGKAACLAIFTGRGLPMPGRTGFHPAMKNLLRWILCGGLWLAGGLHADGPRWWKGNLHTHTLWSDGDGFPEMVGLWYREHGYHFLALSDHNVLSQGERWMNVSNVLARSRGEPWRAGSHRPVDPFRDYLRRFGHDWVETRRNPTNSETQVRLKPFGEYRAQLEVAGRFLMLPAEEITHTAANRKAIHIGAVNLHDWIPTQDGATVPEVLARTLRAVQVSADRNGSPVLVHVNHPNYKWGVTAEDLAQVVEEPFFEVWNGVDGDNDPGDAHHPPTETLWDVANTLRLVTFQAPPLFGLATDDSHDFQGTKRRSPPGRAWVMVRASHLTPESLIHALQVGDFYASTGVELRDVRFDGKERLLTLRIHARPGERLVTRFIGTRRGASLDGRRRIGADGKEIDTTLDYRTGSGPQIGEVLALAKGSNPSYRLRGDELYVRAVVTSSRRVAVATTEAEFQTAWTQPVGWRNLVPAR